MTETIRNQQKMAAVNKKKAAVNSQPAARAEAQPQPVMVNDQMGPTPSQRIMQDLMMAEQRQAYMQQQNLPILAKKMQEPMTVPKMMAQQREQEWMMKKQTEEQIKGQMREQEMANIMPKNVAQDINEGAYMEPQRLKMLEQLYYGLPPKIQKQMIMAGRSLTFEAPMRDYQGGFVDPAAQAAENPLGDNVNDVTNF